MKEFCIVSIDNIRGLEQGLGRLSEEPLNILVGPKNTALVATFFSNFEIEDMYDILNVGSGRTFFLFELKVGSCAVHIDEPNFNNLLFSNFFKQGIDTSLALGESIDVESESLPQKYNESELVLLSDNDKAKLIDKLLDNVTILNDNQKKMLNFLGSR